MIERTTTIAPAITRTRKLSVEQLRNLKLPLIFQEDTIIIERSLNDLKLRQPISIKLEKILEAQEIGLVDYIIRSCLSYQPSIIPYIFDNKSLVKVARHFFRHRSGSHQSCLMYTVKLKKYAVWLGHSPDYHNSGHKTSRSNPRPNQSSKPQRLSKRLRSRTPRRRPQTQLS